MTRTYELAFIVDPRTSDEEHEQIVEKYKKLVTDGGGEIFHLDDWGKRKLAYPINELNEGKYVFLYIKAGGETPPFPDIERLMQQDDHVVRYLTVRTDEDVRRSRTRGKVGPPEPYASMEEEGSAA